MRRTVWHVLLAAWILLALFCLCSVLLVAVLSEAASQTVRNLLLSLFCTVTYAVVLLCLRKVRDGIGVDEVFEDYAEEEYTSMRRDLRHVWRRERAGVIVMWCVILLCYLMNLIYMGILGGERVFPVSFAFIAMTVWQNLFSGGEMNFLLNLVGHLISAAVIPATYLLAVLLHRRRLWGSRFRIRSAHLAKRSRHFYGQFRKR